MLEQPILLRVYVVRGTLTASRMQLVVDDLAARLFAGQVTVEVIDVASDPQRAEEAGILSTPTIDCALPPPLRRVIGLPPTAETLAEALMLPRPPLTKDAR